MSDVATHRVTPPPPDTSRVTSTLAKSRLGVGSVVFFGAGGVAPLMVVAAVSTAAYAITGLQGIPLVFPIVALFLAVFANCYLAMSRRLRSAGAFYTFISHGLGRPLGVGAAAVALVAYNLLQVSLYGIFGTVFGATVESLTGVHAAWWAWAMGLWLIVAVTGQMRIEFNARVLAFFTCGEVLLILILDAVMLLHPAGGRVSFATLNPNLLFSNIGITLAACAVAVAGFVGFEAMATLVEESKDPKKTVPRAVWIVLAGAAILYCLSPWAMSVATGPDQIVSAAGEQTSELMFNLAGPYLPSVFIGLGMILICTSVLAAAIMFHGVVSRYLFSLGREGVLPAALRQASPKTGAPNFASGLQTVIGLLAIAVFAATGMDPFLQMFFLLGVSGGFGVLLLMIATCAAVVVFFIRNPGDESIWSRLIFPLVALAFLLAVGYFVVDQYAILLGVDPASPVVRLFPITFGVAAVLGVLWGLWLKFARPETYQAIGRGSDV